MHHILVTQAKAYVTKTWYKLKLMHLDYLIHHKLMHKLICFGGTEKTNAIVSNSQTHTVPDTIGKLSECFVNYRELQ